MTFVFATWFLPNANKIQNSEIIYFWIQGEYYNQDEVQAMVTAEVLEEERKKKEENAQIEAEMAESAATIQSVETEKSKKKRRKGPLVAA